MSKLHFGNVLLIAAIFSVVAAAPLRAQTLTTLHSFDGTDGQTPAGLVQGTNGVLYGTTPVGGISCPGPCGVVYAITPSGKFGTLYQFCSLTNCLDGMQPNELTLGSDGNLYGSTYEGGFSHYVCISAGLSGCGTLFKITPTGRLTTLYKFCAETPCADGSNPQSAPTFAANGNLYGTTFLGGFIEGDFCPFGCGIVYELSPAGTLTTLHEFCAGRCYDGAGGKELTLGTDGVFYGISNSNRNEAGGSIYRMSPGGSFVTLAQFCTDPNCATGAYLSPLVEGQDGNFYGTTLFGGGPTGGGTFFRITPAGELTTLYDFCSLASCTDGLGAGPIILGTDGNFYGTTTSGGTNCSQDECGTAFKITPTGELTTLYSFCAQSDCADGYRPGALTQGTDGNFYGTTTYGGTSTNCVNGCGTVFKLSTGLKPFVKANPKFGTPGKVVGILGNNLSSTTSVLFNGVPANFKVISGTYLQAQVPSGATTGRITVTTSGGTRSSDVPFQVLP